MQRRNRQATIQGFTLIELMIVVAIVGVLAAIAIPQFLRYSGKAKRTEAVMMLRAINTAETAYYGSYDTFISGSFAATANALALGPIPLKYYTQADLYSCTDFLCPPSTRCPSYVAILSGNLDNDPLTDQLAIQQEDPSCPAFFSGVIPNGIATVIFDDLI